jgi:entericidin B
LPLRRIDTKLPKLRRASAPGAVDDGAVESSPAPDVLSAEEGELKGNLSHDTHVFQWSLSRPQGGTQMTNGQSRTAADRSEFSWLFGLTALLFMVLVLSGCNTMRGMGEDVEAAGGAMSDTAEETEEDIEDEM